MIDILSICLSEIDSNNILKFLMQRDDYEIQVIFINCIKWIGFLDVENPMLLILINLLSFQGKFIQTYHNDDNFYGLTLDAVESVAREGLACVVHMELEVRPIP